MSFGFGSNTNNNNTNNTFGGFGASNAGGFGSNNNASTGGSLFGGNTATAGGFGGFGAPNNTSNSSPFGAPKPAFGTAATSGGGSLFGNNTSTSGTFGSGGGFGATGNTSGFGSNPGGALFGQPKPATSGFGATNTGGSLFGGGASTSGFGASNTTPANPFGANTSSAFGGNANTNPTSGFTFGGTANAATNVNNNSGTANTPFSAVSEKEQPNSNASSLYQSITFQQPYLNKSFEELRTEDYAQGRRFGNSNGQAGSFGQSTGFGGFGATNTNTGGSLFGANASATGSTAFGSNTNNNAAASTFGGFGNSNTNTGSLFGNKPAGGSLFGQQSSGTAAGGFGSTAGTGGSLFGNTNNNTSTSVFGGNNNNANNANNATSLFGSNNNQQQNKPAFGGFGATSNTGAFGSTSNTGTSLFGGNTNNAPNTGGSLFGQNNQQQSNPFGATNNSAGGSLFGNANKPAGGSLFGSNNNTAPSGSLFGAQPNQQQSNPFGQSTNTGGSLFGNLNQNQNKPASTGLFGNTANTGGSVFGGQNNQNAGGSLFGNNANTGGSLFGNNNKPAGSSLFGGNNNSNNGNGLFGSTQANQQGNSGSSLFGGLGQNQQATNSNSLFGGSLNQSQPAQNALHASLTGSPYGNEQLFSSLAAPSPPVGPLATPLNGAKPTPRKTPSLLASARVNTPVYTPRGGSFGRNGGYGFTYSTYGTPGSAYTSGSLTPGASSLLKPTGSLSSALTSRLNKSLSTSNLRGDSVSGEGRSLLRPSAFSSDGTPGRYNSGNVRKLKIDRSLRSDLFGPEPRAIEAAKESDALALKKRVSFDNSSEKEAATPEATPSNALVRTESADESPDTAPRKPWPSAPNGSAPAMEQVSKTLTTVPEDPEAARSSAATASKPAAPKSATRPEIGHYFTKPSLKDLKNMSRQQLKNVGNFVVGREGVGRIEFGTVDLTNTPLEDICGNVVQLNPRSATVYQDDSNKPAMGKALNVPSTIYLENSWPRSPSLKSGKEYDKHIARLKRVAGTHFVKYDPDTGVWCFKVDHFTTYGLDDDEDESELPNDSQMIAASSPLSDAPDTPAQPQDLTLQSIASNPGEMEDTFQFKLDRRSQLSVPGGFEHAHVDGGADYAEDIEERGHLMSGGINDMAMEDPFVSSGGPVQAPSPNTIQQYHSSVMEEEPVQEEEVDLPGSFIDKPREQHRRTLDIPAAHSIFQSPEKFASVGWEEQLNRTLSPRKRDRQALKDMQLSVAGTGEDVMESPFKQSMLGQSVLGQSYLAEKSAKKARTASGNAMRQDLGKSQAFQTAMTAMDLMDNLWPGDKSASNVPAGRRGLEYPNSKKPRLSNPDNSSDAAWHDSMKPNFSNHATFVYSVPASWPQPSGPLTPSILPIVGEHKDTRFAQFTPAADLDAKALLVQRQITKIVLTDGFPNARTPRSIDFASLAEACNNGSPGEQALWRLCSVLYDSLPIACARYIEGIPEQQIEALEPRIRLDALRAFWAESTASSVRERITRARNAEERALLHLTRNDMASACEALVEAKDFNLAVLIAQLPGSEQSRTMMKNQIEVWRNRNDWSEMSDGIRALYSLLAGELCVVEGKGGAAENKATTFNIAERFDLTWQQSFALRLYFGGFHSIVEATGSYIEDINGNREVTRPTSLNDKGAERNDILMEVLRLHAGRHDIQSLFDPLAASDNSLNWRVTWQLASLLAAKRLCRLSSSELDQITYALATQFEAAGDLISGTWALLHVQDTDAQYRAIVALLERHGDRISTPAEGSQGTFEHLIQDLGVPSNIVWRAKALYAKGGLEQPGLQTEWLLQAGDIDDAHAVLCASVGPKAVIEQDYLLLSSLLQQFEGLPVDGWEYGGQVYSDYLNLRRAHSGHRRIPNEEATMQRLSRGLAAMQDEGTGKKTLEERVAIIQMGKVLEQQGNGEHDRAMGGVDGWSAAVGVEGDMLRKYRLAMAA